MSSSLTSRVLKTSLVTWTLRFLGTEHGITALQMDNKAKGLSVDILARALAQAKEGRAFIMKAMLEAIDAPRAELSPYAPHIETIHIHSDKIRDVIGSGGKVIRGLQDETNTTIEIEEDGTVRIASIDAEGGAAAKAAILGYRHGSRGWRSV